MTCEPHLSGKIMPTTCESENNKVGQGCPKVKNTITLFFGKLNLGRFQFKEHAWTVHIHAQACIDWDAICFFENDSLGRDQNLSFWGKMSHVNVLFSFGEARSVSCDHFHT